jgi:hypothetical protein
MTEAARAIWVMRKREWFIEVVMENLERSVRKYGGSSGVRPNPIMAT